VIDVSVSEKRDTAAATTVLSNAMEGTGVRPETVTTERALTSPPAVHTLVPEADHLIGTVEQPGSERDQQHLKARTRSVRCFQQLRRVQVICEGHAFLRNLHLGFDRLTMPKSDPRLQHAARLMRAWDDLTACLGVA
jgi:transposase-like protein